MLDLDFLARCSTLLTIKENLFEIEVYIPMNVTNLAGVLIKRHISFQLYVVLHIIRIEYI
jgi:hypothetical protein